ncbi:hypothetical protein AVEN_191781-1 [Araneus ventricosus]|uniref:EamA domain-containing protein n=1 Tax=Araneus ventricosus TaxID=182803 RepID=A0A4Y2PMJ4_ARAVE|nr:hypothetical protein AVEN_147737-1 [Araneus ventricosus]GBN51760.1 hypothetical protein AVEN_191781-1 [Araneus ventricosus]
MHIRSKSFQLWPEISDEKEKAKKRNWSDLKGFFFAIFSGICSLLTAIIIKKMSLHPAQSALYRFIGSLAMVIPSTVKCKENPFGPKGLRLILLFAGLFGAGSLFSSLLAVGYLPIGEAYVIFATTPVFVTVAGHLFLKEFCDIFHAVLLIFSIIGIIFCSKLPSRMIAKDTSYSIDNLYGLLAALLSVSCRTGQMIFIRKAKHVPHTISTFACCWAGVVESSLLMPLFTEVKLHGCRMEWVGIIMVGFLGFLDQAFMSVAIHCEFVAIVSTTRCAVNIALSFLVQIFLFRDKIDYFSVIGAVLIAFSVVSLGLRKLLSSA